MVWNHGMEEYFRNNLLYTRLKAVEDMMNNATWHELPEENAPREHTSTIIAILSQSLSDHV